MEQGLALTANSIFTRKGWSSAKPRQHDKDFTLAQRCERGERAAQFELYEGYKDWVFNVAYRMANNQHESEEIAQKVFIRVFKKIGSYRGESALSSWIYRMAVNTCINHFRSEKRRRDTISNELSSKENFEVPVAVTGAPNPGLRPYLERAVSALPEGYRMVFVLYDIEGYSHKEIGNMLDISEGTSKSQLHKARVELKNVLKPYMDMFDAF